MIKNKNFKLQCTCTCMYKTINIYGLQCGCVEGEAYDTITVSQPDSLERAQLDPPFYLFNALKVTCSV